jgi:hypothetical protein
MIALFFFATPALQIERVTIPTLYLSGKPDPSAWQKLM